MSFDGFLIYHLVKELRDNLKDARLEKIVSVDASRFLLQFYRRGERHKLMISCDANYFGAYLTQKQYEPYEPSQFLNQIKKHIEGSILFDIMQYETDRVMIFRFKTNDLLEGIIYKDLVFEAMGKHSNLILVENYKIIDCHKKMFFDSGRQLLPQANFEYFPSPKKPFTALDYNDILTYQDLYQNYMGISPFLASYLFTSQKDLSDINLIPTLDQNDHKFYVFDLFDSDHKKTYYKSISELLDAYEPKRKVVITPEAIFLEKELKKAYKKQEYLKQDYEKAQDGLNYKYTGDMIYQSGHDLKNKMTDVTIDDLNISLDPKLTLNENAQLFYKKYQKAKRTIDQVLEQIKNQDAWIDALLELQTSLDMSEGDNLQELDTLLIPFGFKSKKKVLKTQKQQKKPGYLTIIAHDSTFLVGKNAFQNQHITHEVAHKEDYWFHVKDAPGSHVILKTEHLSEPRLRTAAMLAAYFSKLKESQSIPVDYTKIKHIRKIPKHPLYKVTYKEHKTIYIDIDQNTIEKLVKSSSK